MLKYDVIEKLLVMLILHCISWLSSKNRVVKIG